MRKLLYKELKLALHPTVWVFLSMSAMLLIPNYSYHVIFFYTTLGIFFTCLSGRENHDVFYTAILPVSRREQVASRIGVAMIIEAVQLVLAIPFATLRGLLPIGDNLGGLEANPALFGSALVMLGIFNAVFFPAYYRSPDKIGIPFLFASAAQFVYLGLVEASVHFVPIMRDVIDTNSREFIDAQLIVLALGALIFALLTLLARRLSIRSFARVDL